jgi:hypothetical protein
MSDSNPATRRSFLKSGMLLATPIASIATVAHADRAAAADSLKARLARLEDEAAIRELHRSWLRRVSAGESDALPRFTARRVTADPLGAPDQFVFAPDRHSAIGHFDCLVQFASPLALDSTLAQMAHAQGNGAVLRTERRMVMVKYTRTSGSWEIRKVEFEG